MVRALTLFLILLLAACTTAGPSAPTGPTGTTSTTTSATADPSGRVVDLVLPSAALGRDAQVRLLLPGGWAAQPDRRWPVLYLLSGCCGSHLGWTSPGQADRLTRDLDVIVAMPEGGLAGFYTDWADGPAWEAFHLVELREALERDYRASGDRVVAGYSMGGFGALSYTARHPGFFRAAASFSGVVHTTGTDDSRALVRRIVTQADLDPAALWPTDADWAAHNPHDLADALRGVPVYLSCGDGAPGPLDPPGNEVVDALEAELWAENLATAARLTGAGARVTADLYGPGTHTWPYWDRALENALPVLTAALPG